MLVSSIKKSHGQMAPLWLSKKKVFTALNYHVRIKLPLLVVGPLFFLLLILHWVLFLIFSLLLEAPKTLK